MEASDVLMELEPAFSVPLMVAATFPSPLAVNVVADAMVNAVPLVSDDPLALVAVTL